MPPARTTASSWPPIAPLPPPIAPMLASPGAYEVPEIPTGSAAFEPKWDGFRILVFRDGNEVVLQGRDSKPLGYAFPEVVAACREILPSRIVIDGELIIVRDGHLQFEALGARLRPRSEEGGPLITRLSRETPASLVAFDILSVGEDVLLHEPFRERRRRLVSALADTEPPVVVTPLTEDVDVARRWFHDFEGAGLDGLMLKDYEQAYTPGKRTLVKIKHQRTLDAVIGGWRPHASGDGVGSLLLGLYDDVGLLHHIGVASGFSAKRRRELEELLAPLGVTALDGHPWLDADEHVRVPGGVSRWSRGRTAEWQPVRPQLVAEVRYDSFEGDRLRHVATFERWRPDRAPASCRYDQAPRTTPYPVDRILALDERRTAP